MLSNCFSLLLLAFICTKILFQIISLRRNIASAKASNLPYIIVPFSFANRASAILYTILRHVPSSWKNSNWWLSLFASLDFVRAWHTASRPFALMGATSFLTISPASTTLYTADYVVATYFLKSPIYGKPHELLGILNIFGPTMTGTDGPKTRLYRRTTAPFFDEHTMRRVWSNANMGARAYMDLFQEALRGKDGGGYWTERMRTVIARLTLHVVASVCFSRETETRVRMESLSSLLRDEKPRAAERLLTFSKAMDEVLEWYTTIFLTPRTILRYSPLQMHRKAGLAYHELGLYMKGLQAEAESRHATKITDKSSSSSTLLDLLVNGDLKSEEVLGNIFIFLFAGHEANANTLTVLFYLLACHPAAQLRAQEEISRLSDASLYDSAYPALIDGYVGACIHETLRLYTVLPVLVKTVPEQPLPGTSDGREFNTADGIRHRIPPGTMVLINTTALHTDAGQWPLPDPHPTSTPYKSATRTSPVDLFNPDLWLTETEGKAGFLRPKPGLFVPFSDGSRGCLGKRFALVEMCAIVTQVLAEYSIELIAEDAADWQQAREAAARTLLDEVKFHMSLRVTGMVPVRFVKRGEETQFGIH